MQGKKWAAKLPQIVLFGCIAIQILLITYFQHTAYFYSPSFDSDAAAYLLFAEHLVNNGEFPFSSTWFYSTEVWLLTAHLIVTPVYAVLRDYALTQTLSSFLFTVLAAFSTYYCLTGLRLKREWSLLAVFLVLLPYGAGLRYSVVSQYYQTGFYIMYMCASFLFLGLWFRAVLQPSTGWRRNLRWILLGLFSIILGMCGIRYFMILLAPLCLATLAETLLMEDVGSQISGWGVQSLKKMKDLARIAGLTGLAFLSYAALYINILLPAYGGRDFGVLALANSSEIYPNMFFVLIVAIMQMFGFSYKSGPLLSAVGAANYCMLLAALVAMVAAVLLLKNHRNISKGVRLYTLFAWANLALFILITLTTVSPDVGATGRYLKLSCYSWMPLPAVYLGCINHGALKNRVLTVLACIALVAFSANFLLFSTVFPQNNRYIESYGANIYIEEYKFATPDQRAGYIQFLSDAGYDYGYATFWNAGVSTIQADGKVRFAGIANNESMTYHEWLMPKSYADSSNQPEFAVLMLSEVAERENNGWITPGELVYSDYSFCVYDLRDTPWPEAFT